MRDVTHSSAGRAAVNHAIVGADLAALKGAAAELEVRAAGGRNDLSNGRGGAGIDLGDGDRGLCRGCGDGDVVDGGLRNSRGKGGHADGNSEDLLDGELHFGLSDWYDICQRFS